MAERFVGHVNSFSPHFVSYRHDVSDKARQYMSGLMQAGRKNMERMAEVVPEADSRNLQQFLTHSRWVSRDVMDQVAAEASELIGSDRDACLLLDETGFAKQGRKSVGTARQWLGRLGKVDNGQVAVFGALSNGRWVVPIDARLYLPKDWTDDPVRCEEAGIPDEDREFATKHDLAMSIVRHARESGVRFGWVGADAGYGKSAGFFLELDDLGERFLIDVHSDFRVSSGDPEAAGGDRRSTRARGKDATFPVEASDFVAAIPKSQWKKVSVRETTRGLLELRACRATVWIRDAQSKRSRRMELVATESLDGSDRKISLTNAPRATSLRRLGQVQRQRYWIERSFEDAKSECGMADYQARKWSAWHHHMALVMMAMLFMLKERIERQEETPLLSCADVEQLLSTFLPRRSAAPEDVLKEIENRHRRRAAAISSHVRRAARSKRGPAARSTMITKSS